jgi:hypothetical protein
MQADPETVRRALEEVARTLSSRLVLCPREETQDGALVVVRIEGMTYVGEPEVDPSDRFLTPDTVEAIFGLLACDGVFYGYEPSGGTLHVATFDRGLLALSWCDSLEPGPSFARQFFRDGRCRQEDPRLFALAELGLPEDSPTLDRFAFVESVLAEHGVSVFRTDLGVAQPFYAFEVVVEASRYSTGY